MPRLMRPSDEKNYFRQHAEDPQGHGLEAGAFDRTDAGVDAANTGTRRFDVEELGDVIFAEAEVNCMNKRDARTQIFPAIGYDATKICPPFCLWAGWGRACNRCCHQRPSRWRALGDMPFLELLVLQLRSQGIRRIVMCTGHLAGQIEARIRRWP